MPEPHEQLSPLEQSLIELLELEQAGVFEPTALPETPAVRHPAWHGLRRWALVGLPAAACLALAVGIMSFLPSAVDQPQLVTNGSSSFLECWNASGPSGTVAGNCNTYDFDTDGDVDLKDWSEYTTRAHSPR